MFLFNQEEVYIGYSMKELSMVRDVLSREGIKYKYKVIDSSGEWLVPGTSRGRFGSFKVDQNFEKQYVVSVRKKDAVNAKHLVNNALHS